jgi:predicted CopG family antitoxin
VVPNITLSLPEEVYKEMKQFPEVKWSEVARSAIVKRIETFRIAEQIAGKSGLSKKDVREFGKKIKARAAKRFLDENRP